jgi:hypothetical protein
MNLQLIQRQVQRDSILKKYGLDFEIQKRPLKDNDSIEGPIKTPYYGLKNMKTGKYLYSCKAGYQVSQTKDLVDLTLEGIKGFGDMNISQAGSLNGGKKTFLQLGIDGYSSVGNDKITKFVTILDSNDGSSGISFGIGDITASCNNQFFKFYKESAFKIMHSSSMEEKLEQLPMVIQMALEESMRTIELYNEFESTVITKDLAHRMVDNILGIDKTLSKEELKEFSSRKINTMNSIYKHINKEINSKGLNLWGLHSGITSFTTHDKSVSKRENGRVESLLVGSGYKDNHKSLEFCKSMLITN